MIIIYLAYTLVMGKNKYMNYSVIIQGIFGCGIMYFQNRLLFSMCNKSEGLTAMNPRIRKS